MNITEVRIKLMESSEDRLRGFCSITIDDCFVVRDLKIIDGSSGPFVAMPSRKLAGHCQRCGYKNHLRANFCNSCGIKLELDNDFADSPQKLYADVAHPINSECRERIQAAVIAEFEAELTRSRQPGYRSRYDDEFHYEPDGPGPEQEPLAADRRDPPRAETSGAQPPADRLPLIDGGEAAGPPRPKSSDRNHSPGRTTRHPSSDEFGSGIFDG